MAKKRMGFEGKIFYGGAGAEATEEIENSRDISYDFDYDKGDTTERGPADRDGQRHTAEDFHHLDDAQQG